jgi:hypothetical protein
LAPTASIRLLIDPISGKNSVKLYASHPQVRPKIVRVDTPQELYAEFRMYKMWVIQSHGPVVSVVIPNCYAAFMASRAVPKMPACAVCGQPILAGDQVVPTKQVHARCAAPKVEEKFEVNMVEALVGWKGWSVGLKKLKFILSTYESIWHPEQAFTATCGDRKKHKAPDLHCTCGIYAADKKEAAYSTGGKVLGQIYGWGRYIRADAGWRAEFAYPKCFFLRDDQMEHLELLKQYKVPIYVTQPFKVYDPTEEGYEGEEDGNWKAEEDRRSRTGEEPDAEED